MYKSRKYGKVAHCMLNTFRTGPIFGYFPFKSHGTWISMELVWFARQPAPSSSDGQHSSKRQWLSRFSLFLFVPYLSLLSSSSCEAWCPVWMNVVHRVAGRREPKNSHDADPNILHVMTRTNQSVVSIWMDAYTGRLDTFSSSLSPHLLTPSCLS